jgi:hypothetical protein
MTSWRRAELRQCLGFLRSCRRALCAGDLARAFRYHVLAQRSLGLARAFGGSSSVTCTARLSRAVADAGDRIEEALRPREQATAHDLVPHILESLKVLQAQGVDVEDDLLLDRSRNLAMQLAGAYRFEPLANPSTEPCTGLNARTATEKTADQHRSDEIGQKN